MKKKDITEAAISVPRAQRGKALKSALANAPAIDGTAFTHPQNSQNPQNPEALPPDEEPAEAPFPVDCLPPVMADMIRHAARAALVPESLTAVTALAIVSASIGSRLAVLSGGERTTRGNLFILAVAQSGVGKDSAFSIVAEPWMELERETIENWTRDVLPTLDAQIEIAEDDVKDVKKAKRSITGESNGNRDDRTDALVHTRRTLAALSEQRKRVPVLCATDPSREALMRTLSHQEGEASALLDPEARGVVSTILGRYTGGKSTDEDAYCRAYSGSPYKDIRMGRDTIQVAAPRLTILWMMQPDKAAELLSVPAMVESGLMPRFLFFDTQAEPLDVPETCHIIPAKVKKVWRNLVRKLGAAYRLSTEAIAPFAATPEALAILRDFDNATRARRREGADARDIAAFAARWAEQAWRLAVVIHAALYGDRAHHHALGAETAGNAIRLVEWFIAAQGRLLAASRSEFAEKQLGKLVAILARKNPDQSETLRNLRKSHNWKEAAVLAVRARFPDRVEILEQQPAGGGRPTRIVRLKN